MIVQFTPFMLNIVLQLPMMILVQLALPLIFTTAPSWSSKLGGVSHGIWSDGRGLELSSELSTEEVANTIEDIVLAARSQMLMLLGIACSMGIAVPMVGVAVAFSITIVGLQHVRILRNLHFLLDHRNAWGHLQLGGGYIAWINISVPLIGAAVFWFIFGGLGYGFHWMSGLLIIGTLLGGLGAVISKNAMKCFQKRKLKTGSFLAVRY